MVELYTTRCLLSDVMQKVWVSVHKVGGPDPRDPPVHWRSLVSRHWGPEVWMMNHAATAHG